MDDRSNQMKFRNEKEFETHIRELLMSEVATLDSGLTILDNKGVADILICREGFQPRIFFIELKYAKDMIEASEGIQSEILLRNPSYMDNHFMWLIGSQEHPGCYWLLDCHDIQKFVSKNINMRKPNNISRRLLSDAGRRYRFDEPELIEELCEWLHGTD